MIGALPQKRWPVFRQPDLFSRQATPRAVASQIAGTKSLVATEAIEKVFTVGAVGHEPNCF
jgi:hypothetical protein